MLTDIILTVSALGIFVCGVGSLSSLTSWVEDCCPERTTLQPLVAGAVLMAGMTLLGFGITSFASYAHIHELKLLGIVLSF